MFKVILYHPNGEVDDEDHGLFDTEAEATEYGSNWCSEHVAGAEALHESNRGDYDLDAGDDATFKVIEVKDE